MEKLKKLQTQQGMEVLQQIDEVNSTSKIKKMLGMWEKLLDFIQKKHPAKVAAERATAPI